MHIHVQPTPLALHHLERLLDALYAECWQHGRLAGALLVVCLHHAALGDNHERTMQVALCEHMNDVLRPSQR